MTYNETVSGGLIVGGCATITRTEIIVSAFGAGDVLYNINKAKKGVLEKVVIKSYMLAKHSLTQGVRVFVYKDTFNALWNEWELVPYATALALAESYYTNLLAQLDELNEC